MSNTFIIFLLNTFMKMDKVAGSGYDEFYTPEYAVKPILKYIKPNSHIWCPFDTTESHFYKMLKQEGHNVLATHLDVGVDFFNYDMPCAESRGVAVARRPARVCAQPPMQTRGFVGSIHR